MFGSILVLLFLPWLDRSPVRSARFRPIYKWVFWLLVIDCFILGYVGANPPEGWLPVIGLLGTIYYFAHFLIIMPLLGKLERPMRLPESIDKPVLSRGGLAAQPAE
jgi:quinol-cytochrome oxidoreductase complex cytochrome b subunit